MSRRRIGDAVEDALAVAIVLTFLVASWWIVFQGIDAAWRVLK